MIGNSRTQGFTLVEISIVMIIIGLLIGGTFGGMKLIENMQVNRTAQDLKAFTSASVTFKDTYGRLPGDIVNPAARIPNCTDAPCATGGNGNRIIGLQGLWTQSIAATDENFTYYHHLEASGLMSSGIKNTLDMNFGEGQPEAPIGGGYRVVHWNNRALGPCPVNFPGHGFFLTGEATGDAPNGANSRVIPCGLIGALDRKIDDGKAVGGYVQSTCQTVWVCGADDYATTGNSVAFVRGF
ncbi:MAG: prepilin-type N-terminal cleavage/methylation domain-containing protein [Sphingomonadaceae bacterium]|nr:prepilin-type N-terminal cleavage/methylation domain-containing protein [Sphingomonadaceae bacterium]